MAGANAADAAGVGAATGDCLESAGGSGTPGKELDGGSECSANE